MTVTKGLLALREAIAEKLRVDNDLETVPEQIVVTPGSKYALYQSIEVLVDEGDEVVILNPAWVSYPAMVELAGGSITTVNLDPETGFSLGSVDLASAVSDETRALILNNPSNPTGAVFSRAELERIRDLAVDHDIWVISDDIYEKMTYGVEHCSVGSLDGMTGRTVTTNGFSKSYAMSGWRLGYLTAPEEVIESVTRIQSQTVSSATSFAQHGAIKALQGPQESVEEMCQTYESRIDVVLDVLADAGLSIPRPQGAFYVFVPIESDNDVELCQHILHEEHVSTTPGSAFGVSGHIRLACTTTEERLQTGVERLTEYLAT
jgi:aspartate aminotransferase